ncbi:hypothetical protein HPG69_010212 [Diceros bicornis minor]|uniref:Uncharacterized protein n=1 Tax=Diceros bicornis minor TaxID=77932 RepID=A0A7J7EED1_DICBM|nr:hypothetical protein HPG69_010212 [Diceros bicornis minor]
MSSAALLVAVIFLESVCGGEICGLWSVSALPIAGITPIMVNLSIYWITGYTSTVTYDRSLSTKQSLGILRNYLLFLLMPILNSLNRKEGSINWYKIHNWIFMEKRKSP